MADSYTVSPYITPSNGYTCAGCGTFVPDGNAHYCPTTANTPYNPAPMTLMFRTPPCGGAEHDFAVGPTHAVCNRCEKVVKLDA